MQVFFPAHLQVALQCHHRHRHTQGNEQLGKTQQERGIVSGRSSGARPPHRLCVYQISDKVFPGWQSYKLRVSLQACQNSCLLLKSKKMFKALLCKTDNLSKHYSKLTSSGLRGFC